ncbi:helix-turn-helix domain-containing protein [Clostridium algidicarnis]|uniref:helix-turn-helix domain-containing protein n=1 Tax=Clostridium algidicarnis TaxID=37659 RepID=UPI001C0E87C6|nr:helix-turn-helix transcriptional regulator [Clostridium algidicarnis]MBU3208499.1 helix-turn-helix domain-containing protein [Clostridium algidicarnis]
MYKLKIKEYRIKRGLTQKELACKIGISQNYLSQLENNRYDIKLSMLFKIAKELKVPP